VSSKPNFFRVNKKGSGDCLGLEFGASPYDRSNFQQGKRCCFHGDKAMPSCWRRFQLPSPRGERGALKSKGFTPEDGAFKELQCRVRVGRVTMQSATWEVAGRFNVGGGV